MSTKRGFVPRLRDEEGMYTLNHLDLKQRGLKVHIEREKMRERENEW